MSQNVFNFMIIVVMAIICYMIYKTNQQIIELEKRITYILSCFGIIAQKTANGMTVKVTDPAKGFIKENEQ